MLRYDKTILYGQIAVHDPRAPDAYEHWNNADVERGYAWREGHVDFGVPDHDGECHIEVGLASAWNHDLDDAERIIELPFRVTERGIAVSTVMETVPAGDYVLRFALLPHRDGEGDLAWRIVIIFELFDRPTHRIERAGGEMLGRDPVTD